MTREQILSILNDIEFGHTWLSLEWFWDVRESGEGFLICFHFERPDTNTGRMEVGTSRSEYLGPSATEDSVVKTAWVIFELTVRHELMEAFLYKGFRIFNPHSSVKSLSQNCGSEVSAAQ